MDTASMLNTVLFFGIIAAASQSIVWICDIKIRQLFAENRELTHMPSDAPPRRAWHGWGQALYLCTALRNYGIGFAVGISLIWLAELLYWK